MTTLLLAVYVGFVSLMTLLPDPSDLQFSGIADRVLRILYRFGVPGAFGFAELEFTANIAMFVPLGFLLGLALPHRAWWLSLLLLPGYSGFIEFTQATALQSRVSSMMDVVVNTTGGYIGVLLAMILRAMIYARDSRIIERAIWERDAETLRARQLPVARGAARREPDPATAVFGAGWQDTNTAPTQRLPFGRSAWPDPRPRSRRRRHRRIVWRSAEDASDRSLSRSGRGRQMGSPPMDGVPLGSRRAAVRH